MRYHPLLVQSNSKTAAGESPVCILARLLPSLSGEWIAAAERGPLAVSSLLLLQYN